VWPAAGEAPDRASFEANISADRAHVDGAIDHAPSWLVRRLAAAGPVVGDQRYVSIGGVLHPRLIQQAGIRRPDVNDDHTTAPAGDLDP
jgi:hypothetical protein